MKYLLPSRYGISSFPTLKFFPKNNKADEDYDDGRDLEDFVTFINEKCGTDVNTGSAKPIEGTKASNEPHRSWGPFQTSIYLSISCPNGLLRPPLSSSSKELRVSTLHASIGARMRKC